jgi:hypothetical protein
LKTSIYHLLLLIKNIDLHSKGVAGIDFPANGLNLISDNGRAFGFSQGGPLNVEKSRLARPGSLAEHGNNGPSGSGPGQLEPNLFISYLNSPAVDIPSGIASHYKGDFSIYMKQDKRKGTAIVLGCLEGESGAEPTMAASLKGDVSSGSWYFKNVSNTRFSIACATQYERTNLCISTPRNGKPILLNCNVNDASQRFQGIQVKSF